MAIFETIRAAGAKAMNYLQQPVNGTGGFLNTTPDAIKPILTMSDAQRETQERIVVARAFHAGLHGIKLTTRLKQFLGNDSGQFQLRLNMCKKTNKAISRRLVIEGFESTATDDDEKIKQIKFAQKVWDDSRMKGKRGEMFLNTVRDGDGYILIEFDNDANFPRMIPHVSYTDATLFCEGAAGNGEGCWMKYPNDDTDKKPLYGVKRWFEVNDGTDELNPKGQRINVYFGNACFKWNLTDRGWQNFLTVDWTDNGDALGIPMVHLKTPDMLPAAFEAIPLNKGLNKFLCDLFISSDSSANRILIALGWKPVDDDGKPLEIQPGQWVGTENGTDASVTVVEPVALDSAVMVIDKTIGFMSDAVEVPLSMLNRSGQRAAEGTLQEEKEDFGALNRDYTESLEMAIEDALIIARREWNAFAVKSPEIEREYGFGVLDERPKFNVKWKPFSTRTVADKQIEADALLASKVPADVVQQKVWDFAPADTEKWKASEMDEPELP